jgi:hypothetical protein
MTLLPSEDGTFNWQVIYCQAFFCYCCFMLLKTPAYHFCCLLFHRFLGLLYWRGHLGHGKIIPFFLVVYMLKMLLAIAFYLPVFTSTIFCYTPEKRET